MATPGILSEICICGFTWFEDDLKTKLRRSGGESESVLLFGNRRLPTFFRRFFDATDDDKCTRRRRHMHYFLQFFWTKLVANGMLQPSKFQPVNNDLGKHEGKAGKRH